MAGKICVVLFRRTENYVSVGGVVSLGSTVDSVLASATLNRVTWPAGEWEELRVPLTFNPLTLPVVPSVPPLAKQRIGVAIGLDKSGVSNPHYEFQYNTVTFQTSRLEVETTTPLP